MLFAGLFAVVALLLLSTDAVGRVVHEYIEQSRGWYRERGGFLGRGPWEDQ